MRKERAKSILNNGGFNVYRGCDHGCIYCDSRSIVYNIVPPFEDVIVKENAAFLLEEEIRNKKKQLLRTGSMSDPYNHCEKKTEIFRSCLEVILKYHNGIYVLTKSTLILRDLELIKEINKHYQSAVALTITTVDDNVARLIEPNVSLPSERLKALRQFSDAGILTGIWMMPLLPFILDNEETLIATLEAVRDAGCGFIIFFGFGTTMREGSREYFYQKLDESFHGMKQKYIEHYGNKYVCPSPNAKKLTKLFFDFCNKNNIIYDNDQLIKLLGSKNATQLSIFD